MEYLLTPETVRMFLLTTTLSLPRGPLGPFPILSEAGAQSRAWPDLEPKARTGLGAQAANQAQVSESGLIYSEIGAVYICLHL